MAARRGAPVLPYHLAEELQNLVPARSAEAFGEERRTSASASVSTSSSKPRKRHWTVPLLSRVLYSPVFQVTLFVLTIYALFGDDLRLATSPKSGDVFFWAISSATFVFFAVEVVMTWVCRDEYRLGAYFWLDIVSLLSLLPDIGWIPYISSFSAGSSVLRASRASRAGTRAGRFVRLVRLLRILRVSKLLKLQWFARSRGLDDMEVPIEDGEEESTLEALPRLQSRAEAIVLDDDGTCSEAAAPSVEVDRGSLHPDGSFLPDDVDHWLQQHADGLTSSPASSPPHSPPLSPQGASGDGVRGESNDSEEKDQEASNVGKRLTELTTTKVLVIGLLLIFTLPLLEESFYSADADQEAILYGLRNLHRLPQDRNSSGEVTQDELREQCELYWRSVSRIVRFRLFGVDESLTNLWLEALTFRNDDDDSFTLTRDPVTGWEPATERRDRTSIRRVFRPSEILLMETSIEECFEADGTSNSDDCKSLVFVDRRADLRIEAWISIAKTFFIIIMLTLTVILFTANADSLVVDPIERMTAIVKRIANDPMGQTSRKAPEKMKSRRNLSLRNLEDPISDPPDTSDLSETELVERALEKIAALLQVGFGIAGAKVITQCVSRKGDDVDVMMPGQLVTAVIGFGIIHDFTSACSHLKEDVILFTNLLASIVHSACDMHNGAVNKNLGNAFLCVWKICDGHMMGLDVEPRRNVDSNSVADSQSASDSEKSYRKLQQLPPLPKLGKARMVEDLEHEVSTVSGVSEPSSKPSSPSSMRIEPLTRVVNEGAEHSSKPSTPSSMRIEPLNRLVSDATARPLSAKSRRRLDRPSSRGHRRAMSGRVSTREIRDAQKQKGTWGGSSSPVQVWNRPFLDDTFGSNTPKRMKVHVRSNSGHIRMAQRAVPMQKIEAALAAVVKVLNDLQWLQTARTENASGASLEHDEARESMLRLTEMWQEKERREHRQGNEGGDEGGVKKCRMGFGLHLGWAIEGSIGSRYKVDMSYLSPNVNTAARLEAATAQFGCNLLVSGILMGAVGPTCRNVCRLVDVVTVKGSNFPIELWTFDINQPLESCLHLASNMPGKRRGRYGRARVYVEFGTHEDVQRMLYTDDAAVRRQITAFQMKWREAFSAYENGAWPDALHRLKEAADTWEGSKGDGPLKSLLSVIDKHNGTAPLDWRGYRKLTQK